jgi:predicted Rossmann-fold nucleotide-binding protein
LLQTHKIRPFPVILFNSGYWDGLLDWLKKAALARGFITENDLQLLRVSDSVDNVMDIVEKWHRGHELVGRKAFEKRG